MKKLMAIFGSALVLATSGFAFVGCDDGQEEQSAETKKVMNLSLNPQVEFVLDSEDKVVSVNALNEDGNLVVSAEVFVGKSAEEAAQLYVEVCKETGFLVSGNVSEGENELEISFSGDAEAATELYNKVEGKVSEYLSSVNVTAQIEQAKAITEEQLEALVAECAPYIEATQIKALEYGELVETLYESRKETAEFYSQELKKAYYEAKELAMKQAELETLKSKLSSIQALAYDIVYKAYSEASSLLESTRMNLLVSENSVYQMALAAFREAKANYLKYRNYVASLELGNVTVEITANLANYETVLEKAETALENAALTINTQLDTVKTTLDSAYDAVVKLLDEYSVKANAYLEEIEQNQETKQVQFHAEFKTDYASVIVSVEAGWKDMQADLEGTENAA